VHRIEGERFERDRVADRQRRKVDVHVDALGGRDERPRGIRRRSRGGRRRCRAARTERAFRSRRKTRAGRFARSTR
jgi:hypothetical protein